MQNAEAKPQGINKTSKKQIFIVEGMTLVSNFPESTKANTLWDLRKEDTPKQGNYLILLFCNMQKNFQSLTIGKKMKQRKLSNSW